MDRELIYECRDIIQRKLGNMTEPGVGAVKMAGNTLDQMDSIVSVVLLTRTIKVAIAIFEDKQGRMTELRQQVLSIGNDMALISEGLKEIKTEIKQMGKCEEISRLKDLGTKLESVHSALMMRSLDLAGALSFIGPHLPGMLENFQSNLSISGLKDTLNGMEYTKAKSLYSYTLYTLCLALQLATVLSVSTGDNMDLSKNFTKFTNDMFELHQVMRDMDSDYYMRRNCRV